MPTNKDQRTDVSDHLGEEIDISVAVTCYNEEKYIVDTIETVVGSLREFDYSYEVIVIDDVSTDNSVDRIQEYIRSHPEYPVRLVVHKTNQGLAKNFIDGALLAKGKYYRLMPGDNAELKEPMISILKHVGVADIVVPVFNQDEIVGKSHLRRILSKLFTFLVNVLSGYHLGYYNGLPIFLRYNVIRWPNLTCGFGFQADILIRQLDEGVSYVQIPVTGIVEKKGDLAVALSMRNLFSVVHTFLEIVFRRIRRALYGKNDPKPVEIKITEP